MKIDNHDDARPQIALNRSDIVFEELVEGGLTRYLVVWPSDVPEVVGPVRSIRPMDPSIASPFGSVGWPFGEVPLTVLTGSGEAWISVAGKTAHGTWSKDTETSPIALTADDGSVLRLAPGNTWVELVPLEGFASFAP